MSDNLEKEIKACQETPERDTEKQVARIYAILMKLPDPIKHGIQCFIYDCPLTKPIREDYASIDNEDLD